MVINTLLFGMILQVRIRKSPKTSGFFTTRPTWPGQGASRPEGAWVSWGQRAWREAATRNT